MHEENLSKQIIFEDLKAILNDCYKINTDNITLDTLLFSGGISLNSIQMIELTVEIEKHYNFEFEDELMVEENFINLDILSATIMKMLVKQQ